MLRRNLLTASAAAASAAVIGAVCGKANAAHKRDPLPWWIQLPIVKQKCYVFPLWTFNHNARIFTFISICPNIKNNGLYVAETQIAEEYFDAPCDISDLKRTISREVVRRLESAHKEALDSRCSCTGLHTVHSLEFYGKPNYKLEKVLDLYGKALLERVIRVPLTVPCELI